MGAFRLAVIGLSLSSSWGNGHATTYRALLRALAARGADIVFLERDVPWYRENRDLPAPEFARLELYADFPDLDRRFAVTVAQADAVLVGSYVPDGVRVVDWVLAQARGPVAFYDIDTPITLSRLERGEETYVARRQLPEFAVYLSFAGGPTLDRLRAAHHVRRACAFYCSVDDRTYRPLPTHPRRWQIGYLGTYSQDRQSTLETLLLAPARRLPHARFSVAGPQYPGDIAWPANVERIDHCPPAQHSAFYNAQHFTLNVTRADMIGAGWSPSVRLFEAAACGTPIISDRWPGLSEMFPEGEAILIADGTDDVLRFLDMDTAERDRIAAAAREIVLTRHSAAVRARELETILLHAGRWQPKAVADGPQGQHESKAVDFEELPS